MPKQKLADLGAKPPLPTSAKTAKNAPKSSAAKTATRKDAMNFAGVLGSGPRGSPGQSSEDSVFLPKRSILSRAKTAPAISTKTTKHSTNASPSAARRTSGQTGGAAKLKSTGKQSVVQPGIRGRSAIKTGSLHGKPKEVANPLRQLLSVLTQSDQQESVTEAGSASKTGKKKATAEHRLNEHADIKTRQQPPRKKNLKKCMHDDASDNTIDNFLQDNTSNSETTSRASRAASVGSKRIWTQYPPISSSDDISPLRQAVKPRRRSRSRSTKDLKFKKDSSCEDNYNSSNSSQADSPSARQNKAKIKAKPFRKTLLTLGSGSSSPRSNSLSSRRSSNKDSPRRRHMSLHDHLRRRAFEKNQQQKLTEQSSAGGAETEGTPTGKKDAHKDELKKKVKSPTDQPFKARSSSPTKKYTKPRKVDADGLKTSPRVGTDSPRPTGKAAKSHIMATADRHLATSPGRPLNQMVESPGEKKLKEKKLRKQPGGSSGGRAREGKDEGPKGKKKMKEDKRRGEERSPSRKPHGKRGATEVSQQPSDQNLANLLQKYYEMLDQKEEHDKRKEHERRLMECYNSRNKGYKSENFSARLREFQPTRTQARRYPPGNPSGVTPQDSVSRRQSYLKNGRADDQYEQGGYSDEDSYTIDSTTAMAIENDHTDTFNEQASDILDDASLTTVSLNARLEECSSSRDEFLDNKLQVTTSNPKTAVSNVSLTVVNTGEEFDLVVNMVEPPGGGKSADLPSKPEAMELMLSSSECDMSEIRELKSMAFERLQSHSVKEPQLKQAEINIRAAELLRAQQEASREGARGHKSFQEPQSSPVPDKKQENHLSRVDGLKSATTLTCQRDKHEIKVNQPVGESVSLWTTTGQARKIANPLAMSTHSLIAPPRSEAEYLRGKRSKSGIRKTDLLRSVLNSSVQLAQTSASKPSSKRLPLDVDRAGRSAKYGSEKITHRVSQQSLASNDKMSVRDLVSEMSEIVIMRQGLDAASSASIRRRANSPAYLLSPRQPAAKILVSEIPEPCAVNLAGKVDCLSSISGTAVVTKNTTELPGYSYSQDYCNQLTQKPQHTASRVSASQHGQQKRDKRKGSGSSRPSSSGVNQVSKMDELYAESTCSHAHKKHKKRRKSHHEDSSVERKSHDRHKRHTEQSEQPEFTQGQTTPAGSRNTDTTSDECTPRKPADHDRSHKEEQSGQVEQQKQEAGIYVPNAHLDEYLSKAINVKIEECLERKFIKGKAMGLPMQDWCEKIRREIEADVLGAKHQSKNSGVKLKRVGAWHDIDFADEDKCWHHLSPKKPISCPKWECMPFADSCPEVEQKRPSSARRPSKKCLECERTMSTGDVGPIKSPGRDTSMKMSANSTLCQPCLLPRKALSSEIFAGTLSQRDTITCIRPLPFKELSQSERAFLLRKPSGLEKVAKVNYLRQKAAWENYFTSTEYKSTKEVAVATKTSSNILSTDELKDAKVLHVTSTAQIKGDFRVIHIEVSGKLSVAGDMRVDGCLTVTGELFVLKQTAAGGNLVVKGDLSIRNGHLHIDSGMQVDGTVKFVNAKVTGSFGLCSPTDNPDEVESQGHLENITVTSSISDFCFKVKNDEVALSSGSYEDGRYSGHSNESNEELENVKWWESLLKSEGSSATPIVQDFAGGKTAEGNSAAQQSFNFNESGPNGSLMNVDWCKSDDESEACVEEEERDENAESSTEASAAEESDTPVDRDGSPHNEISDGEVSGDDDTSLARERFDTSSSSALDRLHLKAQLALTNPRAFRHAWPGTSAVSKHDQIGEKPSQDFSDATVMTSVWSSSEQGTYADTWQDTSPSTCKNTSLGNGLGYNIADKQSSMNWTSDSLSDKLDMSSATKRRVSFSPDVVDTGSDCPTPELNSYQSRGSYVQFLNKRDHFNSSPAHVRFTQSPPSSGWLQHKLSEFSSPEPQFSSPADSKLFSGDEKVVVQEISRGLVPTHYPSSCASFRVDQHSSGGVTEAELKLRLARDALQQTYEEAFCERKTAEQHEQGQHEIQMQSSMGVESQTGNMDGAICPQVYARKADAFFMSNSSPDFNTRSQPVSTSDLYNSRSACTPEMSGRSFLQESGSYTGNASAQNITTYRAEMEGGRYAGNLMQSDVHRFNEVASDVDIGNLQANSVSSCQHDPRRNFNCITEKQEVFKLNHPGGEDGQDKPADAVSFQASSVVGHAAGANLSSDVQLEDTTRPPWQSVSGLTTSSLRKFELKNTTECASQSLPSYHPRL